MASSAKWPKLKDPRVCRIFFSSPFNGMEGEREALTKLYWPRLQSFCAGRGVQFRAVDMRWGITSESSDDAQVVNICLRELDRSDMFVGFFGQRYGWHGEKDEALQKNFENALGRYPWLADQRDKSVTELEFLHGHLNDPGKLPACFAFRSKAFDDVHREEGVKTGNKRTVYKFSAESDKAFDMLLDLKQRVKDTKDKTLGVWMDYDIPQKGAKYMFDCVWEHLTNVLLADPVGPPPSPREMTKSSHDAFMASRGGVYIGGDQYFKQLDDFTSSGLSQDSGHPLLIMGESGSGKSALLCNWISQRNEDSNTSAFLYHFVGSDKESTSVKAVTQRVVRELRYALRSAKEGQVDCSMEQNNHEGQTEDIQKLKNNADEDPDKDLLDMSVEDLTSQLSIAFTDFKQSSQKAIIVIDGLNKMDSVGKTERPLFWLPKSLPPNVHMLLATSSDDVTNVDELRNNRKCLMLSLAPLSLDTKQDLCSALLKENSKDLSPNQLDLIVSSQQTENPLFLKMVIEELCMFGNFRKLTGKIEELVNSQRIPDLFRQCLERLESDYNTSDHPDIVQHVLCGIYVCQSGLTENQIMAAYKINSNVWSPLYFALEKYLVSRSGVIGFAFVEMKDAIANRYLSLEWERTKHTKLLANFFENDLRERISHDSPVTSQEVEEALYLLHKSGQTMRLSQLLIQVPVLKHMLKYAKYSLLLYWHSTGLSAAQIGVRYIKEIDRYLAEGYTKFLNGQTSSSVPVKDDIHALLQQLKDFFTLAKFYRGAILVLERLILLQENTSIGFEDELGIYDFKYSLACTYVELGEYGKGETLHKDVLDFRERCSKEGKKIDPFKLATSYHGLGTLYYGRKDFEKAEPLLQRSFEIHKGIGGRESVLNITASLNCLGILHSEQQLLDQAQEELEEALRMEEEYYSTEFNPKLAQTMFNLARLYRMKGDLNQALEIYQRSLDISLNALGPKHPDVGMCYLNMGTAEMARGDIESAEQHYRKTVEILEATMEPDFFQLVMAKESMVSAMVQQETPKFEEAEPTFLEVLTILERKNDMDNCLPWLHRKYVDYYQDTKQYSKAARVLAALINSKHAIGLLYVALMNCDFKTPPDQRPVRSDNYSLKAAFERWPTDYDVITPLLLQELIPNRDTEGIKQMCSHYAKSVDPATEDEHPGSVIYIQVIETLKQQENMKEIELAIAETAVEAFPGHLELIRLLAVTLDALGRTTEAYSWMKKLCAKLTDTMNPILALLVAQRAITEGDLDYASDLIGKIGQKWKDEKTSAAVEEFQQILQSVKSSQNS